ncbi:MAG: SDR family oxidoreductase [Elusimicrobiota bacterium]|jgi:UDP-glucuronate decarboxylase|nr:SDR family oxidoreductase [Elusimicrobiota bacterium]
MKTFLISGGAGFLGSHLCKTLIKEGKVIAVDNFYTGHMSNLSSLANNPNFKFINADINQPLSINEKIDYVLNFACPASPPKYQKDPVFTLNTCYKGLANMLDLARINDAVILQASTSEIYGDPSQHPQKESYWGNVNPCGIRSCYDEGKRVGETLMFAYAQKYKVKIKVIRIFNTYGPYMDNDDGRVVSNFVVQALSEQPLTIYGNGEQTRSFCYVDDLIVGIVSMLFSEKSFQGPVNIGASFEFSIKELANIVLALTKSKSTIINKALPSDDPDRRHADISLARQKLGFNPQTTLEEGLKKTIEYFSNKINR